MEDKTSAPTENGARHQASSVERTRDAGDRDNVDNLAEMVLLFKDWNL